MTTKAAIHHTVVVFACGLFPALAIAQLPSGLIGTWVIDAKQTEEYLKKVGPPSHNAEWIPSIVARQCVTTMAFQVDTMIVDPITPAPMAQSFRLEPQQGKELTYSIETADGGKDTLTISFLNDENITVKSTKIELDGYGVWKRGNPVNRQTAERDFKQAFDTCVSALDNVPFLRKKVR